MSRTFTPEEARRIFADAAERQQAAHRESDEHLSLEELEQSAAAAGIDPSFIRAAVQQQLRPSHAPLDRRFLGIQIEARRSVLLPHEVDDAQWGRIVAELRAIFKKHGFATDVGAMREWMSEGSDQRSPVRVTLEPEGDSTRLTIERATWRQTAGLGGGAFGILLTALILVFLQSVGAGGPELVAPAVVMLTLGVLFSLGAVTGSRIMARRDRGRFDEAIRRIREIGPVAARTGGTRLSTAAGRGEAGGSDRHEGLLSLEEDGEEEETPQRARRLRER